MRIVRLPEVGRSDNEAVGIDPCIRLGPSPWELEAALRDFVAYYNNERYHESLDNVTPADAYFGRRYAVVSEREKIKRRTMRKRKKEYLAAMAA